MDISLVTTNQDGKATCLAVLAMQPGVDIPGETVIGSVDKVNGTVAWSSFRRNTTFAEAFVRYMRDETGASPAILGARVAPGQKVYVIDQRTPTPQGDVPWTDIVGWYDSDDEGAPLAETFTYNADHTMVTADGRWSSVLDDDDLVATLA